MTIQEVRLHFIKAFEKIQRNLIIKQKKLNNVQETQKQKKQKLLRFTRGNTPLTAEQQLELFKMNEANLNAIKKHLTYMRGVYEEAKKFER